MQKKIPNLFKVLRADNVDKLKIILESNVNLESYTNDLPAVFDDSPNISAFIAYFGAMQCFDYIIKLIGQKQEQGTSEAKQKKISITQVDNENRSTIHFAAAGGKSKFLRRLIEDFNQIGDIDSLNRNALHYAAEYNQKKALDLLMSFKSLSVNAKDSFGNTPLHLATDNMCTEIVKSLVNDYQCSVNLKDKDGASPLMFAAKVGSLDIFNFLIERNAKIKDKSKTNLSLLHYSAFGNDTDIIDKLVKEMNFTDIDLEDTYKRTPLFYACEKGAFYSAQSFIVDYGADMNHQDVDDAKPIHASAKSGNSRLFRLLIDHCSSIRDFTSVDAFGRTILHYAAEVGSADTIRFFLDFPSDLYQGENKSDDPYLFRNELIQGLSFIGYSALHSAAEFNHQHIIEMLVNNYSFDINLQNLQEETPLHCAVKTDSINSVIMLTKLGADLTIRDKESMTALDIAYLHKNAQIIEILEKSGAQSSRFASEVPSPAIPSSKIDPLDKDRALEPL